MKSFSKSYQGLCLVLALFGFFALGVSSYGDSEIAADQGLASMVIPVTPIASGTWPIATETQPLGSGTLPIASGIIPIGSETVVPPTPIPTVPPKLPITP